MLTRRLARGFSLIELMVTLTVLAIMLAAAIPGLGAWAANARVRSVSEELQNGLRLAQAESVRRNRQAVFVLTGATPVLGAAPAANGANWFVRTLPLVAGEAAPDLDADGTADDNEDRQLFFYVQGGTFGTQSGVTVTGPAVVCFNSVGRQVTNGSTGLGANCTAPDSITPTAYNITRAGSDRAMRVEVFLGGRVRLCDPARTIATQPDGCT